MSLFTFNTKSVRVNNVVVTASPTDAMSLAADGFRVSELLTKDQCDRLFEVACVLVIRKMDTNVSDKNELKRIFHSQKVAFNLRTATLVAYLINVYGKAEVLSQEGACNYR